MELEPKNPSFWGSVDILISGTTQYHFESTQQITVPLDRSSNKFEMCFSGPIGCMSVIQCFL